MTTRTSDDLPPALVPCKTCGTPTNLTGTKLCNPCWEVERRLGDYLRSEQGRYNVRTALAERGPRSPMLSEAAIREHLAAARSSLEGWEEPSGLLIPTEPDPDEREKCRTHLRAAIFAYQRVLGEVD
jgi:hypothetical protein